jgi:hypothetical protein
MDYIKREVCVITGKKDLEHLYTLKDFPVFIGCTSNLPEDDLFADMDWFISKRSGVIQLKKLLPLDIIYSGYHSEAIGDIWKRHHEQFSDFICGNIIDLTIVEMGGSNGTLAEKCLKKNKNIHWTIVEPNIDPKYTPTTSNINICKSYIENQLDIISKSDVFVHSHVLEHLYTPYETMKIVANKQNVGDKMIFSIPDLHKYLKNKYANSINFEHTYFLTDTVTDYLLRRLGYIIKDKKYFEGHSIFYSCEFKGNRDESILKLDFYKDYKALYLSMISFYTEEVKRLNKVINNWDGEVHLFGAHIFSQFLIYMGLESHKIDGIIDNSKEKENKRLYGSSLLVNNPNILVGRDDVLAIVKGGQYQEEIEKQLFEINKDLCIVN